MTELGEWLTWMVRCTTCDRVVIEAVPANGWGRSGIVMGTMSPTELNTLDADEGLLEIKVARGRVPIYESQGEYGSSRCTHGFYKNQQKTPKVEISKGLAIMRADRSR